MAVIVLPLSASGRHLLLAVFFLSILVAVVGSLRWFGQRKSDFLDVVPTSLAWAAAIVFLISAALGHVLEPFPEIKPIQGLCFGILSVALVVDATRQITSSHRIKGTMMPTVVRFVAAIFLGWLAVGMIGDEI